MKSIPHAERSTDAHDIRLVLCELISANHEDGRLLAWWLRRRLKLPITALAMTSDGRRGAPGDGLRALGAWRILQLGI